MSIYNDVQTLEELINQCFDPKTGEILPEDDEAYKALKKELTENGLERCAKVRANKLAYIAGVDAELDRLESGKKREQKQIEWIERYMLLIFGQTEKDKKGHVKAGTFDISMRKSTRVELDKEFNNPLYQQVIETLKVDKALIKKDIQAGILVAGAKLREIQNIQIK